MFTLPDITKDYIRETASTTFIYPLTNQAEVYGKVKLLEITLETRFAQILIWNTPCVNVELNWIRHACSVRSDSLRPHSL